MLGDPSREIYFITIKCQERFRPQLTSREVAEGLFQTIGHRQQQGLWWPYVFLLMPDHLHVLVSFPPSGKPLRGVISNGRSGPPSNSRLMAG